MIGTVRNVGYKFERPAKGTPKPGVASLAFDTAPDLPSLVSEQ